jgi:hypothetical protein
VLPFIGQTCAETSGGCRDYDEPFILVGKIPDSDFRGSDAEYGEGGTDLAAMIGPVVDKDLIINAAYR